MSSTTREETLAHFIECTGLEDVEECIAILDQHEWNLLNAVQVVHERLNGGNAGHTESSVPKHSATTSSSNRSHASGTATASKLSSVVKRSNPITSSQKRCSDSDDNIDSDEPRFIRTVPAASRATRAGNVPVVRGPSRELHFKVEYIDHTERITISDHETIHQLKSKIYEKLRVPINAQKFSNWASKYDDQTPLKDLHLPKENDIHLISTAAANGVARTSSKTTTTSTHTRVSRHPVTPSKGSSVTVSSEYPITVLYDDKTGKTTPYELVLRPTTTIEEMKKEIEKVAHLPIRQQAWDGLLGAKDSDQLRQTQITRRSNLIVHKIESSTNPKLPTHKSTNKKQESDHEYMDVDPPIHAEAFESDLNGLQPHRTYNATATSSSTTSTRELLIPDRCTDDVMGLEHFSRVFHSRFGSTGPILYIGSLAQAIQDSLYTSREERRPLAIYLHNDRSVCANVFCTQVLANDTTIEYLANNYLVWAWDFTTDANRARFFEAFKRCVGYQHAQRISVMEKDAFPLLLTIMRNRGSLELISVIEGKSTPSEVLLNLIQSRELFEQQRQRDTEEEISREQRENLIKQQEAEYNQSLQADLAKEQARLDDERRQKEEHAANERLKEKQLQQQRECKARLPEEPSETEKDTTRLKIRLPNDSGILMRRFRIKDTLQVLFDYLTTQGHMFGEYKLLSTFPKRDLTQLNRLDTFEQLKLYPQEQLILENL